MICTGLVDDERETAEDYRGRLEAMRARDLPMVCANPDIVVERGGQLIPCAGALAALYEEMGGSVLYTGKPHRPIYEAALERVAAAAGRPIDPARVLAIGDAIRTDIAGAAAFGLDALLIARGIHAEELGLLSAATASTRPRSSDGSRRRACGRSGSWISSRGTEAARSSARPARHGRGNPKPRGRVRAGTLPLRGAA